MPKVWLPCFPVMNYPLSASRHRAPFSKSPLAPASSPVLEQAPLSDSLLLSALTVVVLTARDKGQTLAELQAEVLAEDLLLDRHQRLFLSDIVSKAWERMPVALLNVPEPNVPEPSAPEPIAPEPIAPELNIPEPNCSELTIPELCVSRL
jgi:hypothetical protein